MTRYPPFISVTRKRSRGIAIDFVEIGTSCGEVGDILYVLPITKDPDFVQTIYVI